MKEKKIKNGITYVILGIVGVVMLFPVIWMFFACFKTNNEIFGSLSLLPQGWSTEAFIKGWKTTGTLHICPVFHKHLCAGGSHYAADPGVLLHCGLRFCQV